MARTHPSGPTKGGYLRLLVVRDEQQLLSRLFDLSPPPAHPIATSGGKNDWVSVERAIGTALPGDYKAIIDRYGSGDFLDLLILLNPLGHDEVSRGVRCDKCYYFAPDKLAAVPAGRVRMPLDMAGYPGPDLAIKVDVSPSKIDRPGIYAALRVPELWRFDGKRRQIVIERMAEDGSYRPVGRSEFLPVQADEVGRWVLTEDARDGSLWGRRLREWARTELYGPTCKSCSNGFHDGGK